MLSKNDATVVYETLLSSPGMSDEVKMSIRIPRKNVLILSRIIELGLSAQNNDADSLFSTIKGNAIEEIRAVAADILAKAGLTETYNKLNVLQQKG